jgi:hypothetical protein
MKPGFHDTAYIGRFEARTQPNVIQPLCKSIGHSSWFFDVSQVPLSIAISFGNPLALFARFSPSPVPWDRGHSNNY